MACAESDNTEDFLECGSCYENDDLKRLPCSPGHVYCATCLTKDTAETQIVQCPQCRTVFEEGVDSIPPAGDRHLDKFLCCDVCIRKEDKLKLAQIYCVVCKKKFCDTHMKSHNDTLDDHQRISMPEYQSEYRRMETRYCDIHSDQIYSLACDKCCLAFCNKCAPWNTTCARGYFHDARELSELSDKLISALFEKKLWIFDKEESLLELVKQLTRTISGWDTETKGMITNLHQARDKQLNDVRQNFQCLENKLVNMREKSKTELNKFLDDEVGKRLNKLTRQVKKIDSRVFTHHQVDVVREYQNTEKLIDELINMVIPEYKPSDNHVTLSEKKGYSCDIPMEITKLTNPITLQPASKHNLTVTPPTKMELLKTLDIDRPLSVCNYQGTIYFGKLDKSVMRQGSQGRLTRFASLNGSCYGITAHNQELYVLVYENPPFHIEVYNLGGWMLRRWNCEVDGGSCNKICISGGNIIVPDWKNKRLTVSSLDGYIIKHIPCAMLGGSCHAIQPVNENTVIISISDKNSVIRVNIATGRVMWTSKHVTYPMGIACYKEKYVLVTSRGDTNTIWILDIDTGMPVGNVTGVEGSGVNSRFDLELTDDDVLIVPCYGSSKVEFYKLS